MTASNAHTRTARFTPSRWLPCVAALALLAAPVPAVWAQAAPQGASVNDSLDPPGSIARLSLMEGAVSFAPGDAGSDNAWRQAQLNRPLTAGDRLWTGGQSRSELHIGSTRRTPERPDQPGLSGTRRQHDAVAPRAGHGAAARAPAV